MITASCFIVTHLLSNMDLRKDSKGSILHSYSQLHKANTLIFHNLIKNSTIEFMFSLQCDVATTIALTLLDQ